MQLGRTLIGAIIGGAVGIGALIAIYFATKWDYAWLAIIVAVITGLGVRWMVATKGHASYARGGITAVFALAAFVLGTMAVAELATRQSAAAAKKPRPAATEQAAEETGDAGAGAGDATAERVPEPVERPAMSGAMRPGNPNRGYSTMDFIWLSVAAFVAYELGRGTGTTKVDERAAEDDDETIAAGDAT